MASVIVVGAGMAGLVAAQELQRSGQDPVVVDKGRAPGGRMATRRIGDATFDHGAQHFSARSDTFRTAVRRWQEDGLVDVWLRTASVTQPARGVEPRFVGVGGMRRLPEQLAADLDVRTGVQIERLSVSAGAVAAYAGGQVVARGAAAILTPPAPQTLALLADSGIDTGEWGRRLADVRYDATLAVLATLDAPSGLPDGHYASTTGPIAWIADNHHKGSSLVPAVTIHSSASFAAEHLESPEGDWVDVLVTAAADQIRSAVVAARGHRWRFSMPRTSLDVGAARLPAGAPIVLAGEYFAGARVEGAFRSGLAAAALTLESLS